MVLWGLYMGFTQGLLSTSIADAAPADLRGTAYGMFNLLSGAAMLGASVIAGALWDIWGRGGTFRAGAAFTALALVGLLFVRGRIKPAFSSGAHICGPQVSGAAAQTGDVVDIIERTQQSERRSGS